ncbi:DNA polymerase III subunit epsilon [Sodalis-like secondary symbiont of Drepanosiphum platanoidis]|uniref:DNA polymerase III subunit epsilon n=1 Tax=Sodalis-like secondary symbiont of Drepanosiphum platanoidis TaxID=2994493 RepID=UPI0034645E69
MKNKIKRQIVLDTETTGINKDNLPFIGHRIIEIGAVEIINRRLSGKHFHVYLNPNRSIEEEAFKIHGITNEFLINKPTFFQIYKNFLKFINGSELIIHNAQFDIGFLNQELLLINKNIKKIEYFCKIIDSLFLARKIFSFKSCSLNSLCDYYLIDRSKRNLHGALLDAEILADIFLLMTSNQTHIDFNENINKKNILKINKNNNKELINNKKKLKIIYSNKQEKIDHKNIIEKIYKKYKICLWKNL